MGPRHVLLLFAVFYLVTLSQQNDKKVYCGRHLSATLSEVCKGNYNTLNKNTNVYRSKYWEAQYVEDLIYPYRKRATATNIMSQFRRRKKRGVYNECCEKACSYEEIISYCASGINRKR